MIQNAVLRRAWRQSAALLLSRHVPARLPSVAAVMLLVAFFLLDAKGLLRQSVTYDESAHLRYGLQVLSGDTRRLDDSKMPVSALNAVPVALGARLGPGWFAKWLQDYRRARMVTVLAACALALLTWRWSARLYGPWAGLLSLALFVWDPNLQAHAQWVTTDVYAAMGVTFTLWSVGRYLEAPAWTNAILAGGAMGLAQLTKFSCAYLFLILPLVVILTWYGRHQHRPPAGRIAAHAVVFLLLAFAVIGIGYLGNGWGTPLAAYSRSETFRELQRWAGPMARWPLPFPKPFVEGLDWTKSNEEGPLPAYLFGQMKYEPFRQYYAWCFLYKVPLGTQVILVTTLIMILIRPLPSECPRHLIVLLVPAAFYAVYFDFFCRAQIGVRYLLVIFPPLYIAAGSLAAHLKTRLSKCLVAVLVVWSAVSVMLHYPHTLSYFNELAGPPTNYFRILADSNLDWGNNRLFVADYVKQHPGTQVDPMIPHPGRVAISANMITGIIEPELFGWSTWLAENKEPVDHIAYGYLVFVVTSEDIAAMAARR